MKKLYLPVDLRGYTIEDVEVQLDEELNNIDLHLTLYRKPNVEHLVILVSYSYLKIDNWKGEGNNYYFIFEPTGLYLKTRTGLDIGFIPFGAK